MDDLDEQLKELRALRDSLSWTLSHDATRVRYNYNPQHHSSPRIHSSKQRRKTMVIRELDFPIIPRECKFVVVDGGKFRQLPVMMYKMAKLLVTTYDLLGLMHLIEVPVDHTFRPPVFQSLPQYCPPNVSIVEPAFLTGK
ncbi:uncharacterized protein [Halyomorpha halys]|uniref:uncharacterized protein n=1 Tax=Halyomorpha halys TaxID=286706 RepID=UPI0006D4FF6F|nr:uncharacterized protein LOC106691575 [Halyomorpha halys]XP_014292882.1 uncharacterized protein LOC106691575 [Halyomorpha halys]XP_014292883.1 uncharacterized protein LOC106691575 [Halyomorpha halys]